MPTRKRKASETKPATKKKTKAKSKKSEDESELAKLGLAKRTVTALEKAGITTEADLKAKIKAGEKIKGVGPKAVEEIEKAINS